LCERLREEARAFKVKAGIMPEAMLFQVIDEDED